ncbi:acyl-CoA carboxylase subunit beta [Candidatus Dependentiae bacterium]|nr:acyl-CoA carboxylase subunit beta [Candidatus Dependentiae bacterium]
MNTVSKSLREKKKLAISGVSQEKVNKQKLHGKKTARERIELLIDPGSFEEIDTFVTSPILKEKLYTDGVVTGFGSIDGRQMALYSQDFTIKGGSLGKHHAQKICKIMDTAVKIGCPIVGIIDSGGARIDEGIHALAGYGDIFMRNTRYSGVVPQLSIILGPCAGGAVYSPALTDFIFTTEKISQLFITGPQVIKQVMHQDIDKESLGGANVHEEKSGVVHFVSPTEEACFTTFKQFFSYLPSNYKVDPPRDDQPDAPKKFIPAQKLVPEQAQKSYDIRAVIDSIIDTNSFLEIQKKFAPNIIIGFARVEGTVVGVVANQPLVLAGALDINASCKAARFINFCDSFSIPIVSFVDVPGFLPGVDQEHAGIIRHGAKLLAAYAQATVPKITIILRKAFGGAYIVMGSKHLGADFVYAWPTAQIAVLGPQAAVAILNRKQLGTIDDLEEKQILKKTLENQYSQEYLNPFVAAEYGYIDDIIEPCNTRKHLIKALAITKEKVEHLPRKKHANLPL